MNIISELPFLYKKLESRFENVYKVVTSKIGSEQLIIRDFGDLFSDILHHLLEVGLFKNVKIVKSIGVGTYDDRSIIQMYKFENDKESKHYYVIVATYVGSCYGCIQNKYAHECDNDDYCTCERKVPESIKTKLDAFEHFKTKFLEKIKGIVAKATVVENESEAIDMFSEISEKVLDEERARLYVC